MGQMALDLFGGALDMERPTVEALLEHAASVLPHRHVEVVRFSDGSDRVVVFVGFARIELSPVLTGTGTDRRWAVDFMYTGPAHSYGMGTYVKNADELVRLLRTYDGDNRV